MYINHGLLIRIESTVNFATQNTGDSLSSHNTHSKSADNGFIPNVADMVSQSRNPQHTTHQSTDGNKPP